MDAEELAAKRRRLEAERTKLKRARGRAMADSKPFDGARLAEIEHELDALDDAADEIARRQEVVAHTRRVDGHRESIKRLRELSAARASKAGEVQTACEALASKIGDFLKTTEEENALASSLLRGVNLPTEASLSRPNALARLASYLRGPLRLAAGQNHIGHLDISPYPEDPQCGESWASRETRVGAVADAIERAYEMERA
jgi:hypothetical protein